MLSLEERKTTLDLGLAAERGGPTREKHFFVGSIFLSSPLPCGMTLDVISWLWWVSPELRWVAAAVLSLRGFCRAEDTCPLVFPMKLAGTIRRFLS